MNLDESLTSGSIRSAAEKGAKFNLLDPYGNETDIVISIIGFDAPAYKNNQALVLEENAKSESKSSDYDSGVLMVQEAITGWENLECKGEPLECTKENKIKILTEYEWIADQVTQKVHDRKLFF